MPVMILFLCYSANSSSRNGTRFLWTCTWQLHWKSRRSFHQNFLEGKLNCREKLYLTLLTPYLRNSFLYTGYWILNYLNFSCTKISFLCIKKYSSIEPITGINCFEVISEKGLLPVGQRSRSLWQKSTISCIYFTFTSLTIVIIPFWMLSWKEKGNF